VLRLGLLLLLFVVPGAPAQVYATSLPLDHAAIQYGMEANDNLVARLKSQIELYSQDLGGLLKLLKVNPDSQILVFSKTSVQAARISPRNPRAIYFNDEVAVAFVRGGDEMELAALDRQQGTVFYRLKAGKVTRGEDCLHCHHGAATMGVPGMFVGSVYPGPTGLPDRTQAIITDHRTRFADRWGGWYVNAVRGQQVDRSNSVAEDPAEPHALHSEGNQNLTSLQRFFNPAGYLSPVSDIVALMTFEHQTQAANLITRLNWQLRIGDARQQIDQDIDAVASYLLFEGEAPLKEPIEGVSTFTKTFPQHGPLREFDLKTRLFKYPVSYMIYSPLFEALPGQIRKQIRTKILSRLSEEDRRTVVDLWRKTDPDV
jgi:hypothetical protein